MYIANYLPTLSKQNCVHAETLFYYLYTLPYNLAADYMYVPTYMVKFQKAHVRVLLIGWRCTQKNRQGIMCIIRTYMHFNTLIVTQKKV